MELIVGIAILVVVLIVIGKIKGAPKPDALSTDTLMRRIQSEEAWLAKYRSLPFSNQQSNGIKKQYEGKKIYVMELQLEFMKRGLIAQGKDLKETIVPVLRRKLELMKTGMNEENAMNQASEEFVSKRDAT